MVPTTWNWGKNCLQTVDGGIKACAPLRAEEELVSCRWSRGDQLPQKPLKDETWMKDSLELVDRCWRIPKDGWYFWLFLIGPKILLSLDYPLTAVFRQDPIFLNISWDCSFFFWSFCWGLNWAAPPAVGIRTKRDSACAITGAALDGCQYSNAGCRCLLWTWGVDDKIKHLWLDGENSDIPTSKWIIQLFSVQIYQGTASMKHLFIRFRWSQMSNQHPGCWVFGYRTDLVICYNRAMIVIYANTAANPSTSLPSTSIVPERLHEEAHLWRGEYEEAEAELRFIFENETIWDLWVSQILIQVSFSILKPLFAKCLF